MSKSFQFKQFTVEQDRTAMKIGTDGILLGAWAKVENAFSVLDIGAGTGVIALMIAQRTEAETVDAIELDEDAYEQCVDNFENSPWGDRLFCYHASLEEFSEEMDEEKYDLILSNPPFFQPPTAKDNSEEEDVVSNSRKKARFYDSLPFEELIEYASGLLSDFGSLAVIIPYSEEEKFLQLAADVNLFPNRITRVRGNKDASVKRSLLQLSFSKTEPEKNEIILEINRHEYTQEYINLVKEFYLNM